MAARSEVLEMLEVKDVKWFGRLDDDSPKVKWMRHVYPRVDYTQARGPLLCLGSRAKASTLEGRNPYDFSLAPLLVGDSAEVVSSSATSRTEFDST